MGSLGTAALPVLFRHLTVDPAHVRIISPELEDARITRCASRRSRSGIRCATRPPQWIGKQQIGDWIAGKRFVAGVPGIRIRGAAKLRIRL